MALVWLDDIRLHAKVSGPSGGPGLLLLHALGTDLTIWDEVVALLPPDLRVLRYDQRGHGKSDVPAAPYAMGALVRDGERMLQHFAMKDVVVVGVSLGGLVAQGLAVKRLDLVRAMVLSNTAARIGGAALWQVRIAEVRAKGLAAYAPGAMARIFGRHWREAAAMPGLRAMLEATAVEGWVGCASAIAGTDFYTTTAGLTLPTLLIAGAHDGTTPPDLVRETGELIRGSRWHLFRNAGHLPMLEEPQAYAGLLTGFLRDIGHI